MTFIFWETQKNVLSLNDDDPQSLNLRKSISPKLKMLVYWITRYTWETRVAQYTPIWDVLNHSKQDIKEIKTTSGIYTVVVHNAENRAKHQHLN